MRDHYDFSNARPNPYARRLKKAITIRLDPETLDYFKKTAEAVNVPYQTLINLYLRDCAIAPGSIGIRFFRGPPRKLIGNDK